MTRKYVGSCVVCNDVQKQSFSYSSQAPVYFSLAFIANNKVICFNGVGRNVIVEDVERGDEKLWFWEGQNIRSKKDPRYILTLARNGGNTWVLKTETYHDPELEDKKQRFSPTPKQTTYFQILKASNLNIETVILVVLM